MNLKIIFGSYLSLLTSMCKTKKKKQCRNVLYLGAGDYFILFFFPFKGLLYLKWNQLLKQTEIITIYGYIIKYVIQKQTDLLLANFNIQIYLPVDFILIIFFLQAFPNAVMPLESFCPLAGNTALFNSVS